MSADAAQLFSLDRQRFMPAPGARFACLDVETGHAPEEAVQSAIASWKPPANCTKLATIAEKRQEASERIREQSALLDVAPIICVGLQTDTEACEFNAMGACQVPTVPGWTVRHCGSERELLSALATWLDDHTDPATELVGHNIAGFDLLKLRGAYVRHGRALPGGLRVGAGGFQPLFDTMKMFRFFSPENRDNLFPGLDLICQTFALERPKQHISGADVPRLHAEGRFVEILLYNMGDVMATVSVYQRMTA